MKFLEMEQFAFLADLIKEIEAIADEAFTEEVKQELKETIQTTYEDANLRKQIRDSILQNTDGNAITDQVKQSLKDNTDLLFTGLRSEVNLANESKQEIIVALIEQLRETFLNAIDNLESTCGSNPVIYFQFTKEGAKIPTYAHEGDACADVYAPEDVEVPARARGFLMDTGLRAAIPEGYEIKVRPRSGMSMKTPLRISNTEGTIDSSYLGNWGILFDNLSSKPYKISAGDRIAQVAIKPVYTFSSQQVENVEDVKRTTRGNGGFGSSGR